VNGVLLVDTDFGLEALEKWLHGLENALGRVRTQNRYRPRPIDLDVVVWNGKILDSDVFDREYLRRAVLQVLPDLNILI
jgi:2-amino-4-hydroxy-6-hydroxymethyldihydropteridine diphosphokinase